jgi:hypothetical protein
MEKDTIILISSLIINALLILERCFNRIRKSSCLGGNIELSDNKLQNATIELNKFYDLIKNNEKKKDLNVIDKV